MKGIFMTSVCRSWGLVILLAAKNSDTARDLRVSAVSPKPIGDSRGVPPATDIGVISLLNFMVAWSTGARFEHFTYVTTTDLMLADPLLVL
jgi:hypothetical protein